MQHKLWIVLTLILSTALPAAAQASSTIYVPFAPNGNEIVQVATVAPYSDAPACETHDPTAYHGLWDSELGCHYDHTHNVNPTAPEVAAIFGDYTDYTGQEVSYPWQTFAGAAPGLADPPVDAVWENDAKHPGMKFDFYDFSAASYGCPKASAGIKAVPKVWLIERHSLGNKHDYMARVHSVWSMVKLCIPNTTEWAYLYVGGWQDFGQRTSPYKENIVPVTSNPDPPYASELAPYSSHNCIGHVDCRGGDTIANLAWISTIQQNVVEGHELFGFGIRSNDSQQKLDATNGFSQTDPSFVYMCKDALGNYVAAGCKFNHSAGHTYQIAGEIDAALDNLDGVVDGRVTFIGHTDRWGHIVEGCEAIALDCVPLKMVNMPVGPYSVNIAQYGLTNANVMPDYDIYFGTTPSGWISAEN